MRYWLYILSLSIINIFANVIMIQQIFINAFIVTMWVLVTDVKLSLCFGGVLEYALKKGEEEEEVKEKERQGGVE